MALLTPNTIYTANGVKVNEKIIPDGTRWKDGAKAVKAGFSANSLYKKQQRLTNNTGKAKSLTIHNTDDLDNVNDDAEQYTRATYNENMSSVRVHFYVDDLGAWQNMKAGTGACANDPVGSAEVTWHAGDGSTADGGNMTSLSMEIIMNDNAAHDEKAKDNGARLAAWLLWKHGLTVADMVSHTYWVNKAAGKSFSDVDKQCTNLIKNKKWCPAYIFNSYNAATALKNWLAFKALVQGYLDELKGTADKKTENDTPTTTGTLYRVQTGAFSKKANADNLAKELKAKNYDTYIVQIGGLYKVQVGAYSKKANAVTMQAKLKADGYDSFITTNSGKAATTVTQAATSFEEGDKVKVNAGVTTFANGAKMKDWVPSATLYVRGIEQNGKVLLVSTEKTKRVYTGRVKATDVHKV